MFSTNRKSTSSLHLSSCIVLLWIFRWSGTWAFKSHSLHPHKVFMFLPFTSLHMVQTLSFKVTLFTFFCLEDHKASHDLFQLEFKSCAETWAPPQAWDKPITGDHLDNFLPDGNMIGCGGHVLHSLVDREERLAVELFSHSWDGADLSILLQNVDAVPWGGLVEVRGGAGGGEQAASSQDTFFLQDTLYLTQKLFQLTLYAGRWVEDFFVKNVDQESGENSWHMRVQPSYVGGVEISLFSSLSESEKEIELDRSGGKVLVHVKRWSQFRRGAF